ncbi:response regulator transcription factor [bacterium]|nr:response regulator transcription factor [bacterium]
MPKEYILVVEDEEDILELIRHNLSREGYEVRCVSDGHEALREVRLRPPDLIVLDLMLPEIDGLDICRRLKMDQATRHIPIIMESAKSEDSEVITGLELGADDYITKPFSPKVLVARVKSVLRRKAEPEPSKNAVLRFHDIIIHPQKREVLVKGSPVELTNTEFRILHMLAQRPGWVFTRYQIVDDIHGEQYAVSDRSVDVQVVGLRKKLGDQGALIETVRGVGYRLKE